MEWIGPLLLGILVFLSVFQLFWAHTISVIAEKTDQSELFQVLAWIPLLQLAPTLAAGGSSVGAFLLGSIALVMGNLALLAVGVFLGSSLGSLIATLGIVLSGLLCLVYFGRIVARTSIARDLPGWLGLLIFVPVLNIFVYPYIAFHDGWVWPNKIGIAIGSILILGSTAPTFQAVQNLDEKGALSPDFLLTMASGDMADLSELEGQDPKIASFLTNWASFNKEPSAELSKADELAEANQKSLRALYLLKSRFDELDALDTLDDGDRTQLIELLHSIRTDLDHHQSDLDPVTFMELGHHLQEVQDRNHLAKAGNARVTSTTRNMRSRKDQIGPAAMHSSFTEAAPSFGDRLTPPLHPFPVHANDDCPVGTQRQERTGLEQEQEWCQEPTQAGGLRHGWYARYQKNGRPESMGQYNNGLKVGVWTRFYDSGEIRAQAQFESGMQHGWVLTFSKVGKRTRSARYENGILITDHARSTP